MKHILKISLLLSVLLSASINYSYASDNPDLRAAFGHYQQQEYQQAIDIYQSYIDSGLVSDELYYNLGNCYYKIEKIPSAILYYEKALKLNSRNEDAQHNLELVSLMHTDKIEQIPQLFIKRWDKALIRLFPKAWWTVIWMLFFALTLLSVGGLFISHQHKRLFLYSLILSLALSTFSGVYAIKEYNYQNKEQAGIVFTPTLNVKSSPDDSSVNLFVIHAGTRVELLDQVGNWHQISIADGSRGWIKAEDFKGI
jgi:tetratricopeptide (TPR) repeat protein